MLVLIRLKECSELQGLKKDPGLQSYYKNLGPREVSQLVEIWNYGEGFGSRG